MRVRVLWWTGVMLGFGSVGACRGVGRGAPVPESPVFLEVENHSLFEVDVYALPTYSSTPRVRLGTATSFSTTTFTVRRTALRADGSLGLFLHAIGSASSWASPSVPVSSDTRACLNIYADPSGYLGRSDLTTIVTDDSATASSARCRVGSTEHD
jgi:hypothetical protein